MKKIIAIILLTLLLLNYAFAEEEITFAGIPWLSDDEKTANALSETGFIRNGVSFLELNHDNPFCLMVNDENLVFPYQIANTNDVVLTTDLESLVKGKIAGMPIRNIKLTFAYDGEYKIIAVEVELMNTKYEELKSKLNKKYGDGQKTVSEEDIVSIVWRGANNTAVLLYTESEGSNYTLMYGRLDAAEILQNCLAPAAPDDVSGL